MKIQAVKDTSGKVIATFETASAKGATLMPVLEHGHTVHEIDVPEGYHKDIEAVYKTHSK